MTENVEAHLESFINASRGYTDALVALKEKARATEEVILKQCAEAKAELARWESAIGDAKAQHQQVEASIASLKATAANVQREIEREKAALRDLIDGWPRRAA